MTVTVTGDAEEDFSQRSGGSPARSQRDRASDADSPQRPITISGTHVSPRRPVRRRDDDEQSSGLGGPSPNRRNPGSNPLGGASRKRALKHRRARGAAFVLELGLLERNVPHSCESHSGYKVYI